LKQTLFFLGPEDKTYGTLQKGSTAEGEIWLAMNGVLPLTLLIQKDPLIIKNSTVVVAGHNKNVNFHGAVQLNLFNLVGSADSSSQSLLAAKRLADNSHVARVFNHPDFVALTARKVASERYGDIPGLHVPKMTAIADPFVEQETLNRYQGSGRELLLIEYREIRGWNDLFHKVRIAFVDGEIFPRHCILSNHWCIHSHTRDEYMIGNHDARNYEAEFLDRFYDRLGQRQLQVLKELHHRIQLDVWGLDCAFLPDEDGLLFYEANACMNLLPLDDRPEFHYLNDHTKKIKRAIKRLIVRG
jgi:hypothetical protein|tara:strand:- start:1286 stop:2185 length:900 start_codon:yes stop_codon:yes gene_type:complete